MRIYQCTALYFYKRFLAGMGKMECDKHDDNGKTGTGIMCWYCGETAFHLVGMESEKSQAVETNRKSHLYATQLSALLC